MYSSDHSAGIFWDFFIFDPPTRQIPGDNFHEIANFHHKTGNALENALDNSKIHKIITFGRHEHYGFHKQTIPHSGGVILGDNSVIIFENAEAVLCSGTAAQQASQSSLKVSEPQER